MAPRVHLETRGAIGSFFGAFSAHQQIYYITKKSRCKVQIGVLARFLRITQKNIVMFLQFAYCKR